MSDYFVVNVKNLKSSDEELLSEAAFAAGALGVSEILPFDQPEGEEDVFTRIPDHRTIEIYFSAVPEKMIEDLRARFPSAVITVRGETERDWLAEWKKGFVPFALVDGHWVVPSWCEAPIEAKHKIWIDPGMAFGTGTHETTRLVAIELKRLTVGAEFQSCLDVGTGTGILAILAKQLGFQKIRGTELEADSRRVARENFKINSADDIVLNDTQVEDLSDKYDVVVANIIDGVLVRIQDSLKACVKSGGWLVLSGIISEREKDFLNGFQLPKGKTWDHRQQQGDWILYSVRL